VAGETFLRKKNCNSFVRWL